ncbi:MAG TPA: UrcA family protein [Myxococcota bacterium]|nr:UrcA family protein [Myxococcota bacterium]
MIRAKKLALGVSFALLGSVGAAHADSTEQRSVIVSTDGLDLQKPADVDELYRRLHAAARRVCAPLASRSAATQVAYNECREGALQRAIAAVGSDALEQRHYAKRAGARPSAS